MSLRNVDVNSGKGKLVSCPGKEFNEMFLNWQKTRNRNKQAGAELCQAHIKLG